MPAYPLSAVVQADVRAQPPANGIPLRAAVDVLRLAYFDETPPLRATLQARSGTNPAVIVYIGGATTNGEDVLWLEREHRRGIAMVDVAKIAADLDASATQFQLIEPRGGELAVIASTGDGIDLNDRSRYCYWLRLDDELMKVTGVDPKRCTVTVERGFDRSQPAAHRTGTTALGPVYLGNRARLSPRFSASWPGASNRIRYAVDPMSPDGQAYKARHVVHYMKMGYDGAWWDTFEPQPQNVCDVLGRAFGGKTWNFTAGRPVTFDEALESLALYTRNIRQLVKQATGREPVFYGNSVEGTYLRGSKGLMDEPGIHAALDGYCFEDSFAIVEAQPAKVARVGERDPVVPPVPEAIYHAKTGGHWLRSLSMMSDAARSRRQMLCMAGAAGYLAIRFNSECPDYARLLRYSYASFLLTVTAERTTAFGLPMPVRFAADGHAVTDPWPFMLFAAIGDPMQPNDLAALKLADAPVYARHFAAGYVAVHPGLGNQPVTLKAPSGLVDAETRQPVREFTLVPGDAIVLVRP